MNRSVPFTGIVFLFALALAGQAQDVKSPADTVTVEAEGTFDADPDLATLAFLVSAQDKELRLAYQRATESLQRILQLATAKAVPQEDISTGTLTVRPIYDWGDRKRRARAYRVEASVVLRLRDFARVGELIDEGVMEGIVDFRSLTYSLADEEAAKQAAIARAMQRAEARARAALSSNQRRLGELRYVSVDVKQLTGIVRLEEEAEMRESSRLLGFVGARAKSPLALPEMAPAKLSVTATVQCVYELQ